MIGTRRGNSPQTSTHPAHRILYVDDQEPLVALMIHVLSKLGYDVIGCTSSEKALGAFAAQPHNFDAVVSDVRMPGMSGFDLAQQILAIRPRIPILLTSGHIRRRTSKQL